MTREQRRLALIAVLQDGYWSFGGAANKLDVPITAIAADVRAFVDAGIRLRSDGNPNPITRAFRLLCAGERGAAQPRVSRGTSQKRKASQK